MGKKVRSARGEMVDFDLLKIKQQIAAGQAPTTVKNRQEFIDSKIRRRVKKAPVPIAADAAAEDTEESVDQSIEIEDNVDVENPAQLAETSKPVRKIKK